MTRVVWMVSLAVALSAGNPGPAGAQQDQALGVFLDCQTFFCDFDHFRREITFVNWMRDRQDADLHVLGTAQATGGGGREFTFTFIGLRRWAGRTDTLRYVSRNTDTEAETRDGHVRTMKLGLIRYVAVTPAAERISISYQAPTVETPAGPVVDPWDYWVFETRVGGSIDGESRQQAFSVNGSLSASRVTEGLKITLRSFGRYSRDEFELDSVTTFVSTQKNFNVDALVALSAGAHWSWGVSAAARSSTRLNQDLAVEGGPALEFNVFPYAESTRQQLTLQYSVGPAIYDYEQETVFFKTFEVRPRHRLEARVEVRQPWGSLNGSVGGSQFLDAPARHQINLVSGGNLRLFRGLRFNLFGSVARIKDQLYLPRGGATPEEILVRQRQLETDYRFFANFGFSYTFGSKFNNVVNPRMSGGGGGFFFFF